MKKLFFEFIYWIGAVRLASWWNRGQVTILCYHGVTQRAERASSDPHGLHVQVQRFARQLDYLKRHYRVISLREFLEHRQSGRPLPPRSTILTFDDGYRNFLTSAAPELR